MGDNLDISQSISNLWEKLQFWLDSIVAKLPNLVLAVIVIVLFIVIAKYISKGVNRILSRSNTSLSIKGIVSTFIKLSIISIGIFVALGILDLNKVLTSLLAGAGVGALAVGLALQGPLHNTFSGIILSFRPEVEVGDWIETNGFAGKVVEVNLRNVIILQSDNNHVVIPNRDIAENPFKNFSHTTRCRISVECGVGYESDLEEVEKITTDVIADTFKQGFNEMVEFAYQNFGDSSINYIVRFWADAKTQRDIMFLKHKAILAIKKAYNEHNINIPFPIRTLDFGKNKFRAETISIKQE